jgi:hypothetical protein
MHFDRITAAAHDRLLNDPKFASGLSSETRRKLLANPDLLFETIREDAASVLTMSWDGGFPGTAGSSGLQEWHGIYFLTSSDFDDEGPYWSLDGALANEHFAFPTPAVELFSDVIPMERLMQIGLGLVDEGDSICINNRNFRRTSDRLERI